MRVVFRIKSVPSALAVAGAKLDWIKRLMPVEDGVRPLHHIVFDLDGQERSTAAQRMLAQCRIFSETVRERKAWRREFMTRIALAGAACAIVMTVCAVIGAEDEDADNAQNVSAVKACLAIADAKEGAARVVEESSTEEEKTGTSPEAFFATAAAEAALASGHARENCIGVVAYPCAEAEGYSLMAEHACIGVELDVWDSLLNASYRKRLGLPPADPSSEVTPEEEAAEPRAAEPLPDCQPVSCEISANDNLRKTQRAFAAWRDAVCEQNYIESQGGRENQIDISRCHMTLTARQFFWMEYGQSFER